MHPLSMFEHTMSLSRIFLNDENRQSGTGRRSYFDHLCSDLLPLLSLQMSPAMVLTLSKQSRVMRLS